MQALEERLYNGDALTSLGTPSIKHSTTTGSFHARAKPMRALAANNRRLKSTFHNREPKKTARPRQARTTTSQKRNEFRLPKLRLSPSKENTELITRDKPAFNDYLAR